MIKRGKELIRQHMTLEFSFTGVRIQDSFITPVDWYLSVNLIAQGKRGKKAEDIEKIAGLTYQKVLFWLDSSLRYSVFFDVNSENDLKLALLSSNVMMYCPGNPGDELLVRLLHSKITALSQGNLLVSQIELKGTDTSLKYVYDCTDGDYELPSTVEEYFPIPCKHDIPWWSRPDGFTMEFAKVEEGKEDPYKDIEDPMIEFDKIINKPEEITILKQPANIVQVEKWKPKTV